MAIIRFVVRALQRLRWPVRYKVGLAFGLILFCFLVYGLISTWLLLNSRQTQDEMRSLDNYLTRAQRYQDLFNNELNLYTDAIFLTRVNAVHDSFRGVASDMISSGLNSSTTEVDREFEKEYASYYVKTYDHFSLLEILIRSEDFDQAQAKWHEFDPDFKASSALLKNYLTKINLQGRQGQQNLDATFTLSLVIIVVITALSLALGLFLLFLVGQVLVQPLNQLERALGRLAQGDLAQQLQIPNRDEIGRLAQSFSQALLSIQHVVKGVGIGESLQTVTGQLVLVSQQQSAGAAEQVTSLGQVMQTIEQLNSSSQMIADRAVKVAELTTTTRQQIDRVDRAGQVSQARTGQMVVLVENTLNQIEGIGQRVNSFTYTMNELNEQATAISQVVSLLSNIAGEVHLLALNASIEAAGAGEYGERFQIIAREIRQLANRANQANQEATNLVDAVQLSSRLALAQSEQDQLSVQAVIESNSGMRASLGELTASIAQVELAVRELQELAGLVTDQTIEIRQATEQQSHSSQLVIGSARSVGMVAEQTAHTCRQITLSSDQLATLTVQLNTVLNGVRVAV